MFHDKRIRFFTGHTNKASINVFGAKDYRILKAFFSVPEAGSLAMGQPIG